MEKLGSVTVTLALTMKEIVILILGVKMDSIVVQIIAKDFLDLFLRPRGIVVFR